MNFTKSMYVNRNFHQETQQKLLNHKPNQWLLKRFASRISESIRSFIDKITNNQQRDSIKVSVSATEASLIRPFAQSDIFEDFSLKSKIIQEQDYSLKPQVQQIDKIQSVRKRGVISFSNYIENEKKKKFQRNLTKKNQNYLFKKWRKSINQDKKIKRVKENKINDQYVNKKQKLNGNRVQLQIMLNKKLKKSNIQDVIQENEVIDFGYVNFSSQQQEVRELSQSSSISEDFRESVIQKISKENEQSSFMDDCLLIDHAIPKYKRKLNSSFSYHPKDQSSAQSVSKLTSKVLGAKNRNIQFLPTQQKAYSSSEITSQPPSTLQPTLLSIQESLRQSNLVNENTGNRLFQQEHTNQLQSVFDLPVKAQSNQTNPFEQTTSGTSLFTFTNKQASQIFLSSNNNAMIQYQPIQPQEDPIQMKKNKSIDLTYQNDFGQTNNSSGLEGLPILQIQKQDDKQKDIQVGSILFPKAEQSNEVKPIEKLMEITSPKKSLISQPTQIQQNIQSDAQDGQSLLFSGVNQIPKLKGLFGDLGDLRLPKQIFRELKPFTDQIPQDKILSNSLFGNEPIQNSLEINKQIITTGLFSNLIQNTQKTDDGILKTQDNQKEFDSRPRRLAEVQIDVNLENQKSNLNLDKSQQFLRPQPNLKLSSFFQPKPEDQQQLAAPSPQLSGELQEDKQEVKGSNYQTPQKDNIKINPFLQSSPEIGRAQLNSLFSAPFLMKQVDVEQQKEEDKVLDPKLAQKIISPPIPQQQYLQPNQNPFTQVNDTLNQNISFQPSNSQNNSFLHLFGNQNQSQQPQQQTYSLPQQNNLFTQQQPAQTSIFGNMYQQPFNNSQHTSMQVNLSAPPTSGFGNPNTSFSQYSWDQSMDMDEGNRYPNQNIQVTPFNPQQSLFGSQFYNQADLFKPSQQQQQSQSLFGPEIDNKRQASSSDVYSNQGNKKKQKQRIG